ncbi:Uncharacterised protein [Sebaldella termitidis]|uniref:Uncharacterized protein n=1 Tax=Sebaldella termitidis (strain ATCC 33386 / NCTC 11300) TaxID=526218 RepID=D1AN59_SEBTE|nr:hypothetical protein [Sebaldella termitidis]ACZ09663.1 hypothetical protein Sterm_2819 [Sebaldella termitidis ATCC 33386]SUI24995.1 Uncharacterised protein [Sebaldella termitidis]
MKKNLEAKDLLNLHSNIIDKNAKNNIALYNIFLEGQNLILNITNDLFNMLEIDNWRGIHIELLEQITGLEKPSNLSEIQYIALVKAYVNKNYIKTTHDNLVDFLSVFFNISKQYIHIYTPLTPDLDIKEGRMRVFIDYAIDVSLLREYLLIIKAAGIVIDEVEYVAYLKTKSYGLAIYNDEFWYRNAVKITLNDNGVVIKRKFMKSPFYGVNQYNALVLHNENQEIK